MGYAVYHMEKGKSGAGGIGRHIDRIESKYGYSTYGHSDASKRDLNREFILNSHCKKPLTKAIEDRIKEGYTQAREIRKDAVKFQTHILTGSHEEMKEIFSNKETSDKWLQANIDWMIGKYGKENIMRFTLHMDETTPHIHAVTVPITDDGRLSAKSYADGKKALRDIQTDYAQCMEQFGLERGLERVGIKHESALEYYARNKKVDEYLKKPNIKPIEPKTSFLKTNIDEIYQQNQDLSVLVASFSETLNRQKMKLHELSNISLATRHKNRGLIQEKDRIIDHEVGARTEFYKKELSVKNRELSEQKKLLNDPDKLIQLAKELKELEAQRKLEKQQNHQELLNKMAKSILSEALLKLQSGEEVTTLEFDDWIRKYAPKKELGVSNPWNALEVITNGNRFRFEDLLHERIEDLREKLDQQRQEEREKIKQEVKLEQEKIRPQSSRGLRR